MYACTHTYRHKYIHLYIKTTHTCLPTNIHNFIIVFLELLDFQISGNTDFKNFQTSIILEFQQSGNSRNAEILKE